MSIPRRYNRTYPRLSKNYRESSRAAAAISTEKKHGRMSKATAYLCVGCMKQADDYHHPSYRADDRLCVIPLCGSCHQRHHKSGLKLPPLGVVPTRAGLVRIAIATAPVPQAVA